MANSDIIKIGFDYRASLAQFEKETNRRSRRGIDFNCRAARRDFSYPRKTKRRKHKRSHARRGSARSKQNKPVRT